MWEFFFALSPAEWARLLAGEPLFWGQMRPSQQRAFLEVVREHPLAWLASTLPETASFSVHWRRAPVRYPAPSATALEVICASVNPVACYLQLYWAALWRSDDGESDGHTPPPEAVLEMRFAWSAGEVRYSIRRIGIWDWLQALCRQATQTKKSADAPALSAPARNTNAQQGKKDLDAPSPERSGLLTQR